MIRIITLTVTCLLLLTYSCREKQVQISADEYYTCSMHPQVMEDKPGKCPICHMDLIVAKKTKTAREEIELNNEQVRLGNIQVDTIRDGRIGSDLILTATLNIDETRTTSVNAKIGGRIDHLYQKTEGNYVKAGSALYSIYSEELNTAKQEFLAALEQEEKLGNTVVDYGRIVNSSRQKLKLWGMSDQQIRELAKNQNAKEQTIFYSPASGYLMELPVMEGAYVSEGNTIARISSLDNIWAEAQVYATQLSQIGSSGEVEISVPDLPGRKFAGKISFVNPEIESGARVVLVRASISNFENKLRPGMLAYLIFGGPKRNTLTLPSNAVLRNEKETIVWIQTGTNQFKRKLVKTGLEENGRIEIKKGLDEGDRVVTSGTYLLNSEYVFKKGMEEEGQTMHQH